MSQNLLMWFTLKETGLKVGFTATQILNFYFPKQIPMSS